MSIALLWVKEAHTAYSVFRLGLARVEDVQQGGAIFVEGHNSTRSDDVVHFNPGKVDAYATFFVDEFNLTTFENIGYAGEVLGAGGTESDCYAPGEKANAQ